MAEMIPESISASNAPAGEKRLFQILREALLPDEEFIVWHEPKVAKRRPDFLIWAQNLGLIVIEVKDWTLAQIVQAGTDRWIVRLNGLEAAHESPIEQARIARPDRLLQPFALPLHRAVALLQACARRQTD